MSFLLDPPALVMIGIGIGRFVSSDKNRRLAASLVVGLFLIVSVLLYFNLLQWWWGEWIAGTDWMLNSGLGTELTRSLGTDVLAVVLFAAYPLWMGLGLLIGDRLTS